ncbi:hypothetical protein MUP65_02125 [Patescibacteria group bacterium]|nr:hypothetical protein [Patescibacteria group bacterium]
METRQAGLFFSVSGDFVIMRRVVSNFEIMEPEILDQDEVKTTPCQARIRLEDMGFLDSYWDRVMTRGYDGGNFGSHEVRALITIARGSKPQVLGDLYNQMRTADGLEPVDIESRLGSRKERYQR